MLTLTPGVDFDLDFVNARIRDGTGPKPNKGSKPKELLGAWQELWDKSKIRWLFLFLL